MHYCRQNCGSDTHQESPAGPVNSWKALAPGDPRPAPQSLFVIHLATAFQAGSQVIRNHLAAQVGVQGCWGGRNP